MAVPLDYRGAFYMKKFAMLGKWHVHAPGYARELNGLPDCKISKVWDPDEAVAQSWAEELACESASLENIFNDPAIEGVVICNATCDHGPLILQACKAGKAVFTEKVLTLSVKEAMSIKKAIEENGTRFAISFPHFSEPAVLFALHAAQEGLLGSINYVRVRKAHNGASANWLPPHFYDPNACGGGAMIDLGAHPMYLICEILKATPIQVQSAFTDITGHGVEDNAVSLMTFAGGAVGVSETGFVSADYPFMIEIGGDKGTLLLKNNAVSYCCKETKHQWVSAETLPDPLPSPLAQWATASEPEDIPARLNIDAAIRLTHVMEMAYHR